jgi:hypothetical protein
MPLYNEVKRASFWQGLDDRIHLRIEWLRPENVVLCNEWTFESLDAAQKALDEFRQVVNTANRCIVTGKKP